MNIYQVIKTPVITEKSHALAAEGKYVFRIAREATKKEVVEAVETLFKNVKVAKVAIVKSHGKTVRWRKRGARPVKGRRGDIKKAIVTLSKGKIDLFEKK